MLCSCGSRIPDNVEYCPYCGKRQFIKSRPEQLTGGPHIESFKGDYSGTGRKTGCVGQIIGILIFAIAVIAALVFFDHIGMLHYVTEWFSSLHIPSDSFTGAIHFPIII